MGGRKSKLWFINGGSVSISEAGGRTVTFNYFFSLHTYTKSTDGGSCHDLDFRGDWTGITIWWYIGWWDFVQGNKCVHPGEGQKWKLNSKRDRPRSYSPLPPLVPFSDPFSSFFTLLCIPKSWLQWTASAGLFPFWLLVGFDQWEFPKGLRGWEKRAVGESVPSLCSFLASGLFCLWLWSPVTASLRGWPLFHSYELSLGSSTILSPYLFRPRGLG